jgi:tetratricopeptide (TPR) repeat protein
MIFTFPPAAPAARRAFAALILLFGTLVPRHVTAAQSGAAGHGAALFERGDYAAARAELEAALARNPRDADALFYLGRTALQEDRSSDAVDWLEKAVDVDDRNAEYHFWLGAALGEETQRAGKLRQPFLAKRVRTEFDRAVALDPRSVRARLGLAQLYALLPGFMGGNMDRARQQVAELLTISPVHGHVASGFIALREKNTSAAEQAYERAITAAPDSAIGYLSLGALYQRLERWTEAFATYDRLLKRNPDDMAVHLQVGRTAALSGQNLDRGEQSVRRWLARPPRDAQPRSVAGAHHRLGQIYEKKGRRDAARMEYEEALRINPKNDDARKSLAALG